MAVLRKLVNATERGTCPMCGGGATWRARDLHWLCLESGGEHNGPVSPDGRPLTTSEFIEETVNPNPEFRELSRGLNDHMFAEAVERFTAVLQHGISVRLEVGEAIGVLASWASDRALEGERFRTAGEVVAAGYAWRFCERTPDYRDDEAGAPAALFGPPPARKHYLDLQAAQPSDGQMMLLVTASAQTVGAGESVHTYSPGGIVYGRKFLGGGAGLAATTWMNDTQFEALFLNGVCLRDAEPALPPQTDETTGVSVAFTLAEQAESLPPEEAPPPSARPAEPPPKFCTHCGAPASAGPYCAQCGNVIADVGDG